jgi:NAD/NADP transhydrogenase beta subunit
VGDGVGESVAATTGVPVGRAAAVVGVGAAAAEQAPSAATAARSAQPVVTTRVLGRLAIGVISLSGSPVAVGHGAP